MNGSISNDRFYFLRGFAGAFYCCSADHLHGGLAGEFRASQRVGVLLYRTIQLIRWKNRAITMASAPTNADTNGTTER